MIKSIRYQITYSPARVEGNRRCRTSGKYTSIMHSVTTGLANAWKIHSNFSIIDTFILSYNIKNYREYFTASNTIFIPLKTGTYL